MRNTITTTIVLATAALALTACQGPAVGMNADCTDPTALSIIVAAHSNAAPALPAEVSCMVRKAIENGKPISVIREDGAPAAAQSPRVYPVTPATKDNDINNAKITITRSIFAMQAQADGDNPLAALDLAARLTADTPDATIAVISPGLSDQAPLDLTVPALATATPAAVTAQLKAFKAIPNLAGRTVKWYGIGDQHGTQPGLTSSQRQNYQDIYASILSDAGANASFHPGPVVSSKAEPRSGKHGIRPVPTAPQHVVNFPKTGTKVFDNGSSLGFLPDSTGFRTPSAAADTGTQIAQWLVENPAGTITVTGTTASAGTPEARQELSLNRAKAVCALAVSAGADPSRLHAVGAGNDFPGRVLDQLPDGTLDPVAAEANRTVILSFAS